MSRFLLRVGLILFGVGVALLVAEPILFVVNPNARERILPFPYREDDLERIVEGDTYFRFDAEIGWTIGAYATGRIGDVEYRSNGSGVRADQDYRPGRRPEGPRLVAFGDSFTHCDEVQVDECWTAQLEEKWPGMQVINYGVPGYGPDQAWLRYRRRAAEFQPCGVLIGFMAENVNRVVNRFRPFYEPETGIRLSKPRFILEGDELVLVPNPATGPEVLADPGWVERTLGPHDHWYFPGMFASSPLGGLLPMRLWQTARFRAHLEGAPYSKDAEDQLGWAYRPESEPFRVASRILVEFAREVKRDGRSPVVVLFGRKDDIIAYRQRRDVVYEPLLEALKRERVPYVDVTPTLGRLAREIGTLPLVDKHYRKKSHVAVAELLAKELPALVAPTRCGRASR